MPSSEIGGAKYYCESYAEAAERFREASHRAGGSCLSLAVGDDQLTIDVTTIGPSDAERVIVLSSGIHGVEGFVGSAIQLAWLDRTSAVQDARVVLIHAINPYGFAHLRRCNEVNVDLNRNFLDAESEYTGSPNRYREFDPLLNPARAVKGIDLFRAFATWSVLRYGLPALKETIVAGQYDFPQGLFFGGHGPAASTELVRNNIGQWIGNAPEIIHIDLHSGLGQFADCRLMLVQRQDDPDYAWYRSTYDNSVEPLAGGFTYAATGAMGTWLRRRFSERTYRFVTAEFGTFPPLRVLAALRRENQAHHYNDPADNECKSAKRELRECFCPSEPHWREQVVATGLRIIGQSARPPS